MIFCAKAVKLDGLLSNVSLKFFKLISIYRLSDIGKLLWDPKDRLSLDWAHIKKIKRNNSKTNEPVREKTNEMGFQPGPTQTRLYSHRRRQKA